MVFQLMTSTDEVFSSSKRVADNSENIPPYSNFFTQEGFSKKKNKTTLFLNILQGMTRHDVKLK